HELFGLARSLGRCIAFEASCAGGIPIISALRTGLVANEIRGLYGIANGTCNYILSNMSSHGLDFCQALAQAKAKGYAEADPTLDISGQDSAHKLTILASLAFACDIRLEDVYVEGIEGICHADISYGAEMGYVLKLLAIGQRDQDGLISLKVHPSFIPKDSPLARVSGPFNAISIFGHATGQVIFYGRGAGMMPTASAVVADILEVATGNSARTFRHLLIRPREQVKAMIRPIDQHRTRFYIRIMAKDQPGVFAALGQVLASHQISISGALQHEGTGPDNTVPVVIVTHQTSERQMAAALDQMARLDVISGRPVCIRIVDIPEDSEA
ncbi:MAG: homoserine dehydrogenase, partial [Sedimentisphaerales bacterium]|nr:homoserine dehydrogenase [Sedimentisphaerales bacterium]